MKKFRRILSFGMMVCLLLALLPVNVLAAHDSTGRPTDLTGNVYLSVYNGTEFPGEPAEHDVSEYTHLTPELTVGNSTTVYAGSAETVLKSTVLEDVVEGINLQMLIYMMTLWQNGEARYGEVLPAGLLYMPSKTPTVKLENGPLTPETLERRQTQQMRMNGLLLEDEQVLSAMEPGLGGLFIPASLKKDGSFTAASSLATMAQFGALGRRAQRLLEDGADAS